MKWTSVAALFLTVALSAGPIHAGDSWTWLFYMVGEEKDSADMEDESLRVLGELTRVATPDSVQVLAQVDRGRVVSATKRRYYRDPEDTTARRYLIRKDEWKEIGDPVGEVNSGDPATLLAFLEWGMELAPADRFMLVIKGHGSGTISWRGLGAVGSPLPGEVRLPTDRYVGLDSDANDTLTLFELSRVLERFGQKQGRRLDLLVLDTCWAASVEALYQLRSGCEVLVAAESTTRIAGSSFESSLKELAQDPSVPAETVARAVLKGYFDRQVDPEYVMGAYRTDRADDLTAAIDRLSIELVRAHRENPKAVDATNIQNFTDKRYWDLTQIAEGYLHPHNDLERVSNRFEIKRAAIDYLEARAAVHVASWYRGRFWDSDRNAPSVGTLSIFWPREDQYRSEQAFYKALPFAKATHWDEFLDQLILGVTHTP